METSDKNNKSIKSRDSNIKSHNINFEKGSHRLNAHQMKNGRGHDHFADRHNKGRGK